MGGSLTCPGQLNKGVQQTLHAAYTSESTLNAYAQGPFGIQFPSECWASHTHPMPSRSLDCRALGTKQVYGICDGVAAGPRFSMLHPRTQTQITKTFYLVISAEIQSCCLSRQQPVGPPAAASQQAPAQPAPAAPYPSSNSSSHRSSNSSRHLQQQTPTGEDPRVIQAIPLSVSGKVGGRMCSQMDPPPSV